MELTFADFEKVAMHIGTIIAVYDFPEARKPAYQLTIDFGEIIGVKKTSAQITQRYTKDDLIGRQIVAVVNFPKKQIGKFMSECLVLGAVGIDGDVVLLAPDFKIDNGLRIGQFYFLKSTYYYYYYYYYYLNSYKKSPKTEVFGLF